MSPMVLFPPNLTSQLMRNNCNPSSAITSRLMWVRFRVWWISGCRLRTLWVTTQYFLQSESECNGLYVITTISKTILSEKRLSMTSQLWQQQESGPRRTHNNFFHPPTRIVNPTFVHVGKVLSSSRARLGLSRLGVNLC